MNRLVKVSSLIVVGVLFAQAARAETQYPVSRCGTVINHPGSYYLDRDITCSNLTDNGITIKDVREVTLNLNGHVMHGVTSPQLSGGSAIVVSNSTAVTLIGTNSKIDGFTTGVSALQSSSLKVVASLQQKFFIGSKSKGIEVMAGGNVTLSQVVMPNVEAQGIMAQNVDGLQIYGAYVGKQTSSPITGLLIGYCKKVDVSDYQIVKANQAIQIYSSSGKISKVSIGLAGWSAMELRLNNDLVVENATLKALNYGIILGAGDNQNLTIKDTKVTGTTADRSICRRFHPALPILINSSPSITTECVF